MNEGKNNEDFATYKVNDYHFMLFGAYDRLPICMYVGRLQIVCKTSEKKEYIAEDGHVFRKIKTAETMQSPRQST